MDAPVAGDRASGARLLNADLFMRGAMDRWEYNFLLGLCAAMRPVRVLECGPGVSTHALLESGCRVTTLELDERWYATTLNRFNADVRAGALQVIHAANTASLDPSIVSGRYDLAIVDGPPVEHRNSEPWARWNTMALAAQCADTVLLHDALRERERSIIEWYMARGWSASVHRPRDPAAVSGRPPRGMALLRRLTE